MNTLSDSSASLPRPRATSITYRVPYADTDMMGVVYYGNYLTYFERCRNELMRSSGVTYRQMEQDGAMLPVIEAHVQYIHPAHYDDELIITGWIESAQGLKLKIACEITRGNEVIARGYTLHACVSAQTRRPMRIPAYLIEFASTND